MSVAKGLAVIAFAPLFSSWCGGSTNISLCQIIPDPRTLSEYCSLELGKATFRDVASVFRLVPTFDSTHQSLVALQTPHVQLSFGGEYVSVRDEAERIRADGHVRSVMMRRYFATTTQALEFFNSVRRRVESTFVCTKDPQASDSQSMLCSDRRSTGTVIRYLWTNWADDPSAVAPFEVTISARLM